MRTAFRVYIGLMTFTSLVVGVASFALFYTFFVYFDFQILHPIVVPALIGIMAGMIM
jgi:hypothetical protein